MLKNHNDYDNDGRQANHGNGDNRDNGNNHDKRNVAGHTVVFFLDDPSSSVVLQLFIFDLCCFFIHTYIHTYMFFIKSLHKGGR